MCESMSARPVILDCEDTILVSRHHLWCAPPLGARPLAARGHSLQVICTPLGGGGAWRPPSEQVQMTPIRKNSLQQNHPVRWLIIENKKKVIHYSRQKKEWSQYLRATSRADSVVWAVHAS